MFAGLKDKLKTGFGSSTPKPEASDLEQKVIELGEKIVKKFDVPAGDVSRALASLGQGDLTQSMLCAERILDGDLELSAVVGKRGLFPNRDSSYSPLPK